MSTKLENMEVRSARSRSVCEVSSVAINGVRNSCWIVHSQRKRSHRGSAYLINKIKALDICSLGFIKLFDDFTPLCLALFIRGPIATSSKALPVNFYWGPPRP